MRDNPKCPECGYKGPPIQKMWCYLCKKCFRILDYGQFNKCMPPKRRENG